MRQTNPAAALALAVDRRGATPLYRQLYDQLRAMVLAGRIAPGEPLPSTRALVRELGISRTTVCQAFDQLTAEGYIQGVVGSGTYAADVPEDSLATVRREPVPAIAGPPPARLASKRAAAFDGRLLDARTQARAFRHGVPEVDQFPFRQWSQSTARFWRSPPRASLTDVSVGGYRPLRRAIANHLRVTRGLDCAQAQVIVTTGTREAVDLIARTLIDPGDPVWVEEPGYGAIRNALVMAGADVVPVEVDDQGIDTDQGKARAAAARMAVVTPSRQFPLGMTMTFARRLDLLEWARTADAWIVEDDYDSEFRFAGQPIPPLQSLDASGRVIYLGSFSKVLFPALRLGYIVAPPTLVDRLLQTRAAFREEPSIAAQPVLADFMESGTFAQHIRRMRRLYGERQQILRAAADRALGGLLTMPAADGGMHLVAGLGPRLPKTLGDQAIWRLAERHGVTVLPLSAYYMGRPKRQGLLVGYAGVPKPEILAGIDRLAAALIGECVE